MKKKYIQPDIDITKFTAAPILTASDWNDIDWNSYEWDAELAEF